MVKAKKFSQFDDADLNSPTNEMVGFDGSSNVKAAKITRWTTATRPATPFDGLIGYNTDLGQWEYWQDSTSMWQQFLTNISGMSWSEISVPAISASINNGYITNAGGVVAITLPAVCELGDRVAVMGKGSGGWSLIADAGQEIRFGNQISSTAGSLSSTNRYDSVEVVCITPNTLWSVNYVIGNLTVA